MAVRIESCAVHQSLFLQRVGCYACQVEDSEAAVEYVKPAGRVARGYIKPLRGERYELDGASLVIGVRDGAA